MIRFLMANILLMLILTFATAAQSDSYADRVKVLALENLTHVPVVTQRDGSNFELKPGELQAIFYEGMQYEGKPTRVYAWLGIPKRASADNKVPAIVLVHGGGGTAWKAWVEKWNARGFAAISIAVEGQTDDLLPKDEKTGSWRWRTHQWPGPRRPGIYNDLTKRKLEDQWMYHAVSDVILANSLIRSFDVVDSQKVGVMGVSWGGVITSTVIGIDQRFAFAIPTYGCGDLSEAQNKYGKALGKNSVYKNVWDPILRLDRAELPTLWLSWPGEQHFPLDKQASSYGAVSGPYMVSLIPGLGHSQKAAMNPEDSYAFAESIVTSGKPWAQILSSSAQGGKVLVKLTSIRKLDSAVLIWSTDSGVSGSKSWHEKVATLTWSGNEWLVSAALPKDVKAWFVNVKSGVLTISSDYTD